MKNQNYEPSLKKINVAILGTGNIGTDLLVKIIRSEYLHCSLFTGRTNTSVGMNRAKSLGIVTSDQGIKAIIQNPSICDVVIDCTSAQDHPHHWQICKDLGKLVIDMTPAKLGQFCVPAITDADVISSCKNINMITCGGQTAIPIAFALSQSTPEIEYIEVASTIASLSAGPATRQNLDDYIETTQLAIKQFSGAKSSKAILILNPADPPVYMQTTVYAKINNPNLQLITQNVNDMIEKVKDYCPHYQLIVPPVLHNGLVMMTIKVLGAGDHLPEYAGNLDIINSAAIAILEKIAKDSHLKAIR